MKACPFCAEQIQDDAKKCRFCGEWLERHPSPLADVTEEGAVRLFRICPAPGCGASNLASATACRSCGSAALQYAPIREVATGPLATPDARARAAMQQPFSPGVAAVLSFVIPGLGQMYRGRIGAGLLWLLVVVVGYALFVVPGLCLHIACIYAAASRD